MIDLKKQSGMDITYDEENKTAIIEGKTITPSIRTVKDMSDVIFDKGWLSNADPLKELYYMFRDIAKEEDREKIEENNLRYDITVIPSGTLGREYIKTAGHEHPLVPNTSITYTELYEVMYGEALYLMQKTDGNKVSDAYFIKAKTGDKIIIPPGYAHITINTYKKPLIMSNWVARNFKSRYDNIKNLKGAAYFITTQKTIKNAAYTNKSNNIILKKPENPSLLSLKKNESIYSLIKNPFRLKFLTEPQNHHRVFDYILKKPHTEIKLN